VSVLEHLSGARQSRPWKAEAGGQLFAILDERKIEVVAATGPRRTDRRSRWSYVPDVKREAVEIRRMHKAGLQYVGDWHTHPQSIPKPSGLDISSLQECFRLSSHDLNAFLLIVVGRAAFPAGLFVAAVDAHGAYPLTPAAV
jgi:integrative and conjugative element protein (TIGR02256 family)